MKCSLRKVVVALRMAGIAGQDKLNGIFEHLSNGHRWQLVLYRTPEEFTDVTVRAHLRDGADGFIVGLPDAVPALSELAKSRVPTVLMNVAPGPLAHRRLNLFVVKGDSRAVGREAADVLMRPGIFRSFVYLRRTGNPDWSREREIGFAERLRGKGIRPRIYDGTEPLWDLLMRQDRPAALFASCDDDAYKALDICRSHGCVIPDDVSVLGVNNDLLLCENATPRLSSIQPDNIGEGYVAARLLERMMDDFAHDSKLNKRIRTHFVPIRGVVLRESTPSETLSGVLVQRALAFINRRALNGIGVENVAAFVGVSRSLLDLRFRECLHESVYDTILKIRLREVKHRLRNTAQPLPQIAAACGWSNVRSLMNVFKRTFGVSMGAWRRSARWVRPQS